MSINAFPDSIKVIVQNGILERTFQQALMPKLLYRQIATPRPFQANLGERVIFTRTGLMEPVTTPLPPGTDPTPSSYGIEQYEMSLNQYGNAIDTNMLASQIALASKFLEDNQKLAFNAGQSLNWLTRDKLYKAYLSGNAYAVGSGSNSTSLKVNDVNGFTTQLVNGQQTSVSPANPLSITINGTPNAVIGADPTTNTLTLQTAATWADGDPVIASNAPKIIRPNAKTTTMKLQSTDVVTFKHFIAAVAYLRANNVPDFGGYYVAHIDPITEQQLFDDPDFKQALVGRVDSPIYQTFSIGRFAGIDWVRNTEAPTTTGTGGITVRRPIVMGADCLIEGPLQGFGQLLEGTGVDRPGIVTMVNGIALIHRPPLDRLQQIISSAWSWVGDFAVPTDALTGSPAQYKRAVVIEHAG
jgi:N4-gp56 family major capsid protein